MPAFFDLLQNEPEPAVRAVLGHFMFVYRVFGIGFGYGRSGATSEQRLRGRGLVSITTSGAPEAWAEQSGALPDLRRAFDAYLAQVCGLAVLEHRHFGGIVPGLRPDAAQHMLEGVRVTARQLFSASGPTTP